MVSDQRRSSILNFVTFVAILLQSAGCASWQAQRGTPRAALAGNPESAIIVETDGTSWPLRDPAIVGDSIVGTSLLQAKSSGDSISPRKAIPAAKVERVMLRRFSARRTVLIGSSIGFFAFAFLDWIGTYYPGP